MSGSPATKTQSQTSFATATLIRTFERYVSYIFSEKHDDFPNIVFIIHNMSLVSNPKQDQFLNSLKIMVKKKQSVELLVEEGWYSECELKDEVGWSQFLPQLCCMMSHFSIEWFRNMFRIRELHHVPNIPQPIIGKRLMGRNLTA